MFMNEPEPITENTEESNSYTFVPFNENDPPLQPVAQVAFDKLSEFKVVAIRYYNDKGTISKQHFTKSKKSFYNKRAKTFALKSCIDGSLHAISVYNIAGVDYPTSPEQEQEFLKEAEDNKTAYLELSSTCSLDYDLANCFFDCQLIDRSKIKTMMLLGVPSITEYNTPSPETLSKSQDTFIALVKTRVLTEKENIEKEFSTLPSTEDGEDTNVELNSVLEFLTQIEEDTIRKAKTTTTIEELIEVWPPMLCLFEE
jgi:hypothetical protein